MRFKLNLVPLLRETSVTKTSVSFDSHRSYLFDTWSIPS